MSIAGASGGRGSLALRTRGSGGLQGWAYVAAACALAAVVGVGYALGAYRVDPALPPLVLGVAVALTLGVWRLEYGLSLLIVVTPFAENVPITDVAHAKLRVALVAWAAILVAIECCRTLANRRAIAAPPMAGAVALFLAAALIAVPVAADEAAAASKWMLLAGSVAIYLLIGMFLDDMRKLRPVLAALVVVGLVVAGHALYQYAVKDFSRVGFLDATGTVEYRIASFFPHPNQLAGFLAVLVPVGLAVARASRGHVLRVAGVILSVAAVAGVVLTYSRGGLVALIALPLVLIRDKRSWPLIVAGIVLIALLAPSVWRDRVAQVAQTDQPEIATRIDFWDASLDMFQAHPVTGVGLDSFSDAYQALERPGRSYLGGGVLVAPETAHNLYLNTLAEQGLIGFTALAILLGSFFTMAARLGRSKDPRIRALSFGLVGAGVVAAVHNFFDVTFSDPKNGTLLWVLFGIGAALTRIEARSAAGESAESR
jgi:putative inorganic carbon (HCO3(-)) transporter